MKEIACNLMSEANRNIENIDPCLIERFDNLIHSHSRIFIVGAGRSGLVGRFFGMRLMHLGKDVHIVGETCTPRICEKSVLIAISGSGETASVAAVCKKAKESKATIVLFTSRESSTLSGLSDMVIRIANHAGVCHKGINIMPMGTVFEITTLLLLESSIGRAIFHFKIPEAVLKERHTNLE